MDFTEIGFIALAVITITDVIKEAFPNVTGNMTRLYALMIGLAIGSLSQVGLLPDLHITLIQGGLAGLAAVGGHTVANLMRPDAPVVNNVVQGPNLNTNADLPADPNNDPEGELPTFNDIPSEPLPAMQTDPENGAIRGAVGEL